MALALDRSGKSLLPNALRPRDSQRDVDRQRSQERHAQLFCFVTSSSTAKDVVGLAAIGTGKATHVFDHAQDRNADLLEHADGLHCIQQRDFLRRTDHDRSGDRYDLRKRQRNVARPGGMSITKYPARPNSYRPKIV